MSARDDLVYRITRHVSAETAAQMIDAYRAEVLSKAAAEADAHADRAVDRLTALAIRNVAAEQRRMAGEKSSREANATPELLPKADVVAWLTKKAREETPVWLLASKVERGAIRPDNLRMLPEDGVDPLVVRWDRTVIHPEADPTDDTIVCCLTDDGHPVALLLDDEHREALGLLLVDPAGDGEPAPELTGRLAQLLDAIRAQGGEWGPKRVQKLYRSLGIPAPLRVTAKKDLHALREMGYLDQHEVGGRRFFTLVRRESRP